MSEPDFNPFDWANVALVILVAAIVLMLVK